MKKEQIISFAQGVFHNLRHEKENLYKGEIRIKASAPAAIFYLRFTDELSEENFPALQDDIIEDDYYANPGHIQWNYYILLFPQKKVSLHIKKIIEQNYHYARKYVIGDISEFKNLFEHVSYKPIKIPDVVSLMKSRLNNNSLHDLHGSISVQRAWERFKNSEKPAEEHAVTLDYQDKISALNFIQNITINSNFRSYIKKPVTYSFARVNLIIGNNGAGKTSLLEAIELLVTGKNVRNEKDQPDGCITGLLNDGISDRAQPTKIAKYIERDRRWYARLSDNNRLHYSFNHYNFFSTDDAYRLSYSFEEADITSALKNLIFGAEYAHIADRVEEFSTKLQPEYEQLDKQYKGWQNRLEQRKLGLESLLADPFNESLYKNLAELVSNAGFRRDFPNVREQLPQINEACARVLLLTEKITTTTTYKINNRNDLRLANDLFSKYRDSLESLSTTYKQNSMALNYYATQLEEEQLKLKNLQRCLYYLNLPEFDLLKALVLDYEKLKTTVNRLSQLEVLLDEFEAVGIRSETIETAVRKNQERNRRLSIEIQSETARKETLELSAPLIDKEIHDLRQAVRNYISHDPGIDSCPVCQTKMTVEELQALLNSENVLGYSRELLYIERQIVFLQTQLLDVFTKASQLESLQRNLEDTGNYKKENTIGHQIDLLKEFVKKGAEDRKQLRRLDDFKKHIHNERDFMEKEFERLYNWAKANDLIFENDAKEDLENKLGETRTRIFELEQTVKNNRLELQQTLKYLNDLIRMNERKRIEHIGQVDEFILNQQESLKEVDKLFENLAELVMINGETLVSEIELHIKVLKDKVSDLRNDISHRKLISDYQTEIDQLTNNIRINEEPLRRFEVALKILREVGNEDSKNKLGDFFNKHLEEISGVFGAIHQPREFKGIRFEKNRLILDHIDGHTRTMNEISTGQRSAFALSIFITLNRKLTDGPHIMLLDDPVTFTDDMNTLSFLDYLRFFILKEGKQVFFATANEKMANLFERKFQFLGVDFKKIPLSRSDV